MTRSKQDNFYATRGLLKPNVHKASEQIEAKQKKEIIDIIQDILKNKAWTLREDGEMIYSELKKKGFIRLK